MFYPAVVCCICLSYLTVSAASKHINYGHYSIMQPNTTDFTRGLQKLLQRIQNESAFFGYFLLRNHPADCVDEQLASSFKLPFMQLNESFPVYVRATGNSFLLAIVCMKVLTEKDFLLAFAKSMQHIRTRRVLAIYNGDLASSAKSDIVTFFQHCEQVRFLHAVLIHRDFVTTHVYHSYNQFPEFELETRDLRANTPIYLSRFANVGRKRLRILIDQIEPITMLYRDNGKLVIDGYIGYFLKTFASRYNFQLYLPDGYDATAEHVLYMEEIRRAARNDSIDVGASLSTPQKEENLHEYIYPVEFYQWLTMLPVEAPLDAYQFYIQVFGPAVIVCLFATVWCMSVIDAIHVRLAHGRCLPDKRTLLILLVNPWHLDLLRGIICQSSTVRFNYGTRRIIFILIFALGGTLNSFFSTKLVNWLTVPPRERPIETFSDVGKRNLQIQVSEPDIAEIKFFKGEHFWRQHRHLFKVVPTFDEYQKNIRKLDNRYGYIMSSLLWPTIRERQKYFKYPLFRISKNLFYTKGSLLSLPISENSMYKDLLSDFCLRARETGLLDHWYKETFFTMVRLKRFSLKDPSGKHMHQVFTLQEFEWVWLTYFVGIFMSSVAFFLERPWKKR